MNHHVVKVVGVKVRERGGERKNGRKNESEFDEKDTKKVTHSLIQSVTLRKKGMDAHMVVWWQDKHQSITLESQQNAPSLGQQEQQQQPCWSGDPFSLSSHVLHSFPRFSLDLNGIRWEWLKQYLNSSGSGKRLSWGLKDFTDEKGILWVFFCATSILLLFLQALPPPPPSLLHQFHGNCQGQPERACLKFPA